LAALAFAELGDFERAVDHYERVLKAERASAPILALEQLANCKVRWAGRLLEAEPADDKKVSELLEHAEKILRHLIDLGPTSERWALLGGLMKRRAIGAARDAKLRRKALEEMREAYKNAYDLSRANGAGDAFPLGNQIAADLVLSWRGNASGKQDDARAGVAASLKELRTIADGLSSSNTDFFSLVVVADQMLLQALMEGRLDDKTRDGILQKFQRALSRGITARQRDSVRTQLLFFRRLMQAGLPKEDRDKIVPQLEFLEQKLVPRTPSTERR
jgi:tetratricopeptide (TPR) repeat protein